MEILNLTMKPLFGQRIDPHTGGLEGSVFLLALGATTREATNVLNSIIAINFFSNRFPAVDIGQIIYDDVEGNIVEIALANDDDKNDPLIFFDFLVTNDNRTGTIGSLDRDIWNSVS